MRVTSSGRYVTTKELKGGSSFVSSLYHSFSSFIHFFIALIYRRHLDGVHCIICARISISIIHISPLIRSKVRSIAAGCIGAHLARGKVKSVKHALSWSLGSKELPLSLLLIKVELNCSWKALTERRSLQGSSLPSYGTVRSPM